jgi:hypothetical protein
LHHDFNGALSDIIFSSDFLSASDSLCLDKILSTCLTPRHHLYYIDCLLIFLICDRRFADLQLVEESTEDKSLSSSKI